MKALQITAHFSPNVGGVETHLNDLVNFLSKKSWKVFVLTYSPLTTKAKWEIYERKQNVSIFRIPWLSGLFFKLIPYPMLEFLYLLPGLFMGTLFVILFNKPKVIHAHGLVAGAAGVFWGKVFGIKTIISLHSIYSFPKEGLYRKFTKFIFSNADFILGLSKQSVKEIKNLG